MRKALTGISLAVLLTLGSAGCASGSGGSSGGSSGALDPAGASSSGSDASPAADATQSAAGVQSFTFPSGVQVQFQTQLPASGPQRTAVIGYENYVDSMWAAVSTGGANTTYEKYIGGNALSFANSLISEFRNGDDKLSGTVVYFDISVPQTFYGESAVVQSCVDASGLNMVSAATGKVTGTVFDSSYQHYQEQVAVGKSPAGYWTVSHTENSPASSGGAAGDCI
ncbi:MAG TPA: hypothetical protein VG142_10545 [Trebonia sp.]|jgi:hypothetical protein|nr:hypothetical protein [Trebonia sp.]